MLGVPSSYCVLMAAFCAIVEALCSQSSKASSDVWPTGGRSGVEDAFKECSDFLESDAQ